MNTGGCSRGKQNIPVVSDMLRTCGGALAHDISTLHFAYYIRSQRTASHTPVSVFCTFFAKGENVRDPRSSP